MEKSLYQLRIVVDEKNYDAVSSIVGLRPRDYLHGWVYQIILEEEPIVVNPIEIFLNALNTKYDALTRLGIEKGNITIWLIYEYNNQCNMEFSPNTLSKLGENGIALCISCYEAGYDD